MTNQTAFFQIHFSLNWLKIQKYFLKSNHLIHLYIKVLTFFFNQSLSVKKTTKYNLLIDNNFLNMDVFLMIMHENNNKTKRMKAITENKIQNVNIILLYLIFFSIKFVLFKKWCTTCDLKAGCYFLFPYTSGTFLKKRKPDNEKTRSSSNILVTNDAKGRLKLSEKYL
jgi:hypothetical protein